MSDPYGILQFHEQYFERIWGGERLRKLYGKPTPIGRPIGEAWLISDHPTATSIVKHGPHADRTLHELIEEDPVGLVGSRDMLTPSGRFPLLLKMLDSDDVLSVQVHPDDAIARELGEPDVGKTEMWYVMHAEPGAELFAGMKEGVTEAKMRDAIVQGELEHYLMRRAVRPGDSVFVAAGTVHAIGGGIVLAEIQQNSDLTYRLYDWNRKDRDGKARELHIEKGLKSTNLDARPALGTRNQTKSGEINRTSKATLVQSDFFTTTHLSVAEPCAIEKAKQFLIVFCASGDVSVSNETDTLKLEPGSCCLIAASQPNLTIGGMGEALLYSVSPVTAT